MLGVERYGTTLAGIAECNTLGVETYGATLAGTSYVSSACSEAGACVRLGMACGWLQAELC